MCSYSRYVFLSQFVSPRWATVLLLLLLLEDLLSAGGRDVQEPPGSTGVQLLLVPTQRPHVHHPHHLLLLREKRRNSEFQRVLQTSNFKCSELINDLAYDDIFEASNIANSWNPMISDELILLHQTHKFERRLKMGLCYSPLIWFQPLSVVYFLEEALMVSIRFPILARWSWVDWPDLLPQYLLWGCESPWQPEPGRWWSAQGPDPSSYPSPAETQGDKMNRQMKGEREKQKTGKKLCNKSCMMVTEHQGEHLHLCYRCRVL